MKVEVTFEHEICKIGVDDDGTQQASSTRIEVGDTINVRLRGFREATAASAEFEDLTVTAVANDGRTIGWDREAATDDFYSEDIAAANILHNKTAQTGSLTVALPTKAGAATTTIAVGLDGAAADTLSTVAHDSYADQAALDAATLTAVQAAFPDAYQSGTDIIAPYTTSVTPTFTMTT